MPNKYSKKLDCWCSLFALKGSLDLNTVIVIGDFNTHLNQGEKKGVIGFKTPLVKKSWTLFPIGTFNISNH